MNTLNLSLDRKILCIFNIHEILILHYLVHMLTILIMRVFFLYISVELNLRFLYQRATFIRRYLIRRPCFIGFHNPLYIHNLMRFLTKLSNKKLFNTHQSLFLFHFQHLWVILCTYQSAVIFTLIHIIKNKSVCLLILRLNCKYRKNGIVEW